MNNLWTFPNNDKQSYVTRQWSWRSWFACTLLCNSDVVAFEWRVGNCLSAVYVRFLLEAQNFFHLWLFYIKMHSRLAQANNFNLISMQKLFALAFWCHKVKFRPWINFSRFVEVNTNWYFPTRVNCEGVFW